MEYYEKELMQLKEHIVQLQEQFGGLNDINDLYETVFIFVIIISLTTNITNSEYIATLKHQHKCS